MASANASTERGLREAFRGLSFVSNPPASAFAIGSGHSPNAVRIALASPPIDVLTHALPVLADLARSAPDWNTE